METRYDVLVAGDEVESILTAVSAARTGATVVLIRRSIGRLGGLSVRGGLSYMDITPEFATGLFGEFLRRAGVKRVALNPDVADLVLGALLHEAGVTLISDVEATVVVDDAGHPAVVNCKTREDDFQLEAAVVIDATPDADLMRSLGVPYILGLGGILGEDENFLGISPVFRLAGVDYQALQAFEASLRERPDLPETLEAALKYHPQDLRREYLTRPTYAPGDMDYLDILNPVIGIDFYRWRHGRVDDYADAAVFIDGGNVSRLSDGSLGFNGLVARPDALDLDLDDLIALSRGGPIPEELADEMAAFERYLREVGGFAQANVIPPEEMYVRQTLNLLARHNMTAADALAGGVPKEKAVATFSYWLDLRGTQMWRKYPGEHLAKPVFNIGLDVALPVYPDLHNIGFVSRSAGYSPLGQGAGRIVQHNSLLGEAFGIAAALSARDGHLLSEYAEARIGEVQAVLKSRHGSEQCLEAQPAATAEEIAASRLLQEDAAIVARMREQILTAAGPG